jgi:hypothetical protein
VTLLAILNSIQPPILRAHANAKPVGWKFDPRTEVLTYDQKHTQLDITILNSALLLQVSTSALGSKLIESVSHLSALVIHRLHRHDKSMALLAICLYWPFASIFLPPKL